GDGATEAAVRQLLVDYPVLHLATHGYLSEEAPLLSSILLANGEALTVYELMGLQLNADLIVLSACETARGQTTGGDDVLGLTRGLLAA
ncbi:MAG: CHAT domain-containing protein, partial [Anaerolineae bacterium]|nr:CHAT domain-containing protein [Anaerolineae bacterium]